LLDATKWDGIAVKLLWRILPLAILDELEAIVGDYKPAENLLALIVIVLLGDYVAGDLFHFAGMCPPHVNWRLLEGRCPCFGHVVLLNSGLGDQTISVYVLPFGLGLPKQSHGLLKLLG
jgi:hypothetical protein